jgi:hypothetical protein
MPDVDVAVVLAVVRRVAWRCENPATMCFGESGHTSCIEVCGCECRGKQVFRVSSLSATGSKSKSRVFGPWNLVINVTERINGKSRETRQTPSSPGTFPVQMLLCLQDTK